jgi:HAD superfamily hydrolase (TIGR01490 family)
VSGSKIAFFDFDGTITTKDSLLEIIRFQKGIAAFYAGLFFQLPWLIAFKIKILPNDAAKQKMLTYFFGGMNEFAFQSACDQFAEKKIPSLIRPDALVEINRLRDQGFDIVVVTASAGNWVKPWTDSVGIRLISTRLEVKQGKITGRIEGKNCHGEEKVIRIREEYKLSDYQEIYAYGDSSADKPMLGLATNSFYKPFRSS